MRKGHTRRGKVLDSESGCKMSTKLDIFLSVTAIWESLHSISDVFY